MIREERKFFVEALLETDKKLPSPTNILQQQQQHQLQIQNRQNVSSYFYLIEQFLRMSANKSIRFHPVPQICHYRVPIFMHCYSTSYPTNLVQYPVVNAGGSGAEQNTVAELKRSRKKRRHAFSAEQTHFLESHFQAQRYISTEQRATISEQLALSQQQALAPLLKF
uniref:Homeobox domain-containing protein n=1 Tax=Globodera pallida TaxID=36090 RepID=A0A183BP74_GLOPA